MKSLKFKNHLAEMIIERTKTTTWRFFDEKDLKQNEEILLINKETMREFGKAKIIECYEKEFKDLNDYDKEGHESFASNEEMLQTYKSYYPNKDVNENTILKILKFEVINLN